MHFSVSWDIQAQGEKHTLINDEMAAVIKNYSWIKPLTTYYIVKVNSQADWQSVLDNLGKIVERHQGTQIRFVMTPLINGGRYNGRLPSNWWTDINKRTDS